MNADLEALVAALRRKPMTAREICALFQISKPTAYARIERVREAGVEVITSKKKTGKTGPVPERFSVE